MLEALGRLCQEPGGQEFIARVVRQTPTWVMHMPWLAAEAAFKALQRRVMGATQERMLQELAETLALVAAARPLILVLENLHLLNR